MALADILKKSQTLITDNSPAIMTALAISGTIATGVLAGKGAYEAALLVHDEETRELERGQIMKLDLKTKVNLTWKFYVPAAATALFTIGSIVALNKIGTRRTAAMTAVYSISEKAFDEYKAKVVEKWGESKEREVRDEIMQDHIDKGLPCEREVVIVAPGEVLCYDKMTGRYFQSSMEELKKAQNDLNYKILNSYYASLSDFYNLIGLNPTTFSDAIGWNCDELMELQFTTTISDDQRPCLAIEFKTSPISKFHRVQ